jgi:hypothetical protein
MDIFKQIVEADPTSLIDGVLYVGKYSKWLLKLFKEDKLKIEDLYKATEYLELFDKQSVRNRLEVNFRNINNFKSLGELAEKILKYKESDDIKSKTEIKEDNLVKEFKNYKLYIPKNYKDSCILGKGTEWCTATEKTDKFFKKYHKTGRELLIFIDKNDPKNKYQFHFRSEQFMDKFDKEIDIKDFLNKYPDIDSWLKENVKDYKKINVGEEVRWEKSNFDGCSETINGTFICSENNISTLKGSPKIIKGNFHCANNELTSLEGGPKTIEGGFYCSSNKLITLVGAPETVDGDFSCSYNILTTLEGCPKIVEGDFECYNNKLTSLVGAPETVDGGFNCKFNKLTSLKGCPKRIEGDFWCFDNKLTSLEGCPEIVEGDFSCSYNKLTSLEGCPETIEGNFYCYSNNLISLNGGPKIVEGDFNCYENDLTSLKGCPEIVEGIFNCRNNPHLTEKDFEWLKQNCKIGGKIYK